MLEHQIRGLADLSQVEETKIKAFKARLGGKLLKPGDAEYDPARTIYNRMIDKQPQLIVRCAGVADVLQSVDFARSNNLLVAVRGGGHNVTGNALCEGGLVIDLSQMKGIRVDPVNRVARAEPGLTWGEFDRETQAFGLATTGGIVSTTGIAGLTLGGGLGWLMRSYGLACDNLRSVDIVTANGQLLTASAKENQELFWAVRGGGGNFGIVTSLEYLLHPVDQMLGGRLIHPFTRAREVLEFYREFRRTAPEELNLQAGLLTSPEGNPVVAYVLCYNGPREAGERAIEPLRAFGPPLLDEVRPMSYREVQTMYDEAFPAGLNNYWKSDFLTGLSDDAITTLINHFAAVPSPLDVIGFDHLGGAVSRVSNHETAFRHRHAEYNLAIFARWTNPADAEKNIQWARDLWSATQPFSTGGVYVNFLGEEGEDRVKAAYGPTTYNRLVGLKNRYDPTNFFQLNQNIKPSL